MLSTRTSIALVSFFCLLHSAAAETPREALERLCTVKRITVLLDGYCPARFAQEKAHTTVYQIADALDCDIENYYGFYLLRKRYAIGQDTPAITVEEMDTSLRRIKQGFDLYGVNMTQTSAEKASLAMGRSMFSYRLAELAKVPKQDGSESDWLTVSKLGPEAVTLLRQFDTANFIGYPTSLITSSVNELKNISTIKLAGNSAASVSLMRNDANGQPTFRSLKFQKLAFNVELFEREPETLGFWCQKESDKTLGFTFSTVDMLKDRPLCFFGRENSRPKDRMEAAARLLGLKFSIQRTGAALNPISPPMPKDITELPAYAAACLPLTVRRATQFSREPDLLVRCESILFHAWERLASQDNRGVIALKELNSIEKSALAFLVSAPGIAVPVVMPPSPRGGLHEFIGREDQVQIRVKYYTDEETKEPRRSMDIVSPQADGSKRTLLLITNMRYQP